MEEVLNTVASILGFFLGTFLFSRVGAWIEAKLSARAFPVIALSINSGPWLVAAVAYWGYHVLSKPHASAWDWFFAASVAAIPVWLVVLFLLHWRNKHRALP